MAREATVSNLTVDTDADIASVVCDYTFLSNGKKTNWGVAPPPRKSRKQATSATYPILPELLRYRHPGVIVLARGWLELQHTQVDAQHALGLRNILYAKSVWTHLRQRVDS